MFIGYDDFGKPLRVGDKCSFIFKNEVYEGVIKYCDEEFVFIFEIEDDKFPAVHMKNCDNIRRLD